jgi:hypothetical protein
MLFGSLLDALVPLMGLAVADASGARLILSCPSDEIESRRIYVTLNRLGLRGFLFHASEYRTGVVPLARTKWGLLRLNLSHYPVAAQLDPQLASCYNP